MATPLLTNMTQKSSNKKFIPNDVTEEILLKLPAKSLLRFMCVSQRWHDRMRQLFRQILLQRNIADDYIAAKHDATLNILHKNASCDELIIKDRLELPHGNYYNPYIKIFCSCDGILCYSYGLKTSLHYELVLFNPNIRKHKILKVQHRAFAIDTFALGYDSSIDDYKLIRISKTMLSASNYISDIVEVMAMKYNQWRQVSCNLDFSPYFTLTEPAMSLNGAVFWLLRAPKRAILCFHLANETFSEMSLPNECGEVESLLELKGKLCLISDLNTSGSSIWIMKDENWVRLFTGFFRSDINGCQFVYIEGGAFLKTMKGTVYIHGMKEKTNRKAINICSHTLSAIVCANSLIFP